MYEATKRIGLRDYTISVVQPETITANCVLDLRNAAISISADASIRDLLTAYQHVNAFERPRLYRQPMPPENLLPPTEQS
jgi:hypothetical protein